MRKTKKMLGKKSLASKLAEMTTEALTAYIAEHKQKMASAGLYERGEYATLARAAEYELANR